MLLAKVHLCRTVETKKPALQATLGKPLCQKRSEMHCFTAKICFTVIHRQSKTETIKNNTERCVMGQQKLASLLANSISLTG